MPNGDLSKMVERELEKMGDISSLEAGLLNSKEKRKKPGSSDAPYDKFETVDAKGPLRNPCVRCCCFFCISSFFRWIIVLAALGLAAFAYSKAVEGGWAPHHQVVWNKQVKPALTYAGESVRNRIAGVPVGASGSSSTPPSENSVKHEEHDKPNGPGNAPQDRSESSKKPEVSPVTTEDKSGNGVESDDSKDASAEGKSSDAAEFKSGGGGASTEGKSSGKASDSSNNESAEPTPALSSSSNESVKATPAPHKEIQGLESLTGGKREQVKEQPAETPAPPSEDTTEVENPAKEDTPSKEDGKANAQAAEVAPPTTKVTTPPADAAEDEGVEKKDAQAYENQPLIKKSAGNSLEDAKRASKADTPAVAEATPALANDVATKNQTASAAMGTSTPVESNEENPPVNTSTSAKENSTTTATLEATAPSNFPSTSVAATKEMPAEEVKVTSDAAPTPAKIEAPATNSTAAPAKATTNMVSSSPAAPAEAKTVPAHTRSADKTAPSTAEEATEREATGAAEAIAVTSTVGGTKQETVTVTPAYLKATPAATIATTVEPTDKPRGEVKSPAPASPKGVPAPPPVEKPATTGAASAATKEPIANKVDVASPAPAAKVVEAGTLPVKVEQPAVTPVNGEATNNTTEDTVALPAKKIEGEEQLDAVGSPSEAADLIEMPLVKGTVPESKPATAIPVAAEKEPAVSEKSVKDTNSVPIGLAVVGGNKTSDAGVVTTDVSTSAVPDSSTSDLN